MYVYLLLLQNYQLIHVVDDQCCKNFQVLVLPGNYLKFSLEFYNICHQLSVKEYWYPNMTLAKRYFEIPNRL